MNEVMVDLRCQRLQVDEIWSYVYAKAKNAPPEKMGEAGDVWTWVAIDADTKLVLLTSSGLGGVPKPIAS